MSYGSRQSDLHAAESEKNRAGVRVSMPVKVLAFYPDKMTVDVQPLVFQSTRPVMDNYIHFSNRTQSANCTKRLFKF